MKRLLKFSILFLAFGFFLSGCQEEPLSDPADDPNIGNGEPFTYNQNEYDWELAKKCALYSVLAYDETRIMRYNSYPNKPSKQEFDDLLSKYTPDDIQYFTGERGDEYVGKDNTPIVLHAHLKWEGFIPDKIDSKNYGDKEKHNISYTLAYKYVNGDEILLVVILRGTDREEWFGNMDIWEPVNNNYWETTPETLQLF